MAKLYAPERRSEPIVEAPCRTRRRKLSDLADIAEAASRKGKKTPAISPLALELSSTRVSIAVFVMLRSFRARAAIVTLAAGVSTEIFECH